MALSVVDLYSKVLPKTNCKDCGFPTCIAFAGKVVSQKYPLNKCPHIPLDILTWAQGELEQQYKEGKWLQKDMAAEALAWAKKRTASMSLSDIALRINATPETHNGQERLFLPYFNHHLYIYKDRITDHQDQPLSPNEQTFVYIHMAHGGKQSPSGRMKSFKEFPNTVSKIKNMEDRVETPLKQSFSQNPDQIIQKAISHGAKDVSDQYPSSDCALSFSVFPQIPVVALFWHAQDEFDPDAKLLFDETILEHLDIESIMFLSEHLTQLLL